jgi:hypothetical protein
LRKAQEIRKPARRKKLTKTLRKSKISVDDGKTLIDLEKELTCHKNHHKGGPCPGQGKSGDPHHLGLLKF